MNVGTRNTRALTTLLFCFLSKMRDFLWKSDTLVTIQLVMIPQFFCRPRYRLVLVIKSTPYNLSLISIMLLMPSDPI